ncbi:MAG: cysteate synthase [Nitrospiraceae bacterium]|nr:cysteate synthase [Nitrospiraceae bacterium]
MSHFTIRCRKCGKELKEVYCAFCEHCLDSLLVTVYKDQLMRDDGGEGIWRFNWLPVHSASFAQAGTVVYRSEGLGPRLGLSNLFISFNGYWPERGGHIATCTFKEFEAAVVLQNAIENEVTGLVVASAGNTARAFAHLSVVSGFPVVIVVPKMCLQEMWYLESSSLVPTVAVADGDYSDSIDVARRIAGIFGFPFEGGVKNIAKRDGLGITILEAVSKIGNLPDHYFQAVGSGTGAIGVWEMSERLISDGRYGTRLPTLHLAQNLPFAPMVKAWDRKSRQLLAEDLRPELIGEITTRVLSTRYPAYSMQGGVFDAMTACGGQMYGVVNEEVYAAMELFEETEGIDIVPAAGVATGALRQAVAAGTIDRDGVILLNITGGGEERLGQERKTHDVEPVVISKTTPDREIEEKLCSILKRS